MNREYVMLASTIKDPSQIPKGLVWSTKYDGMRALWLPTTRGLKVYQVPWCHDPEPQRTCTGLFSRYGKVIHAPDSFLDKLPDFPLDGELWTGRGDFQRLISICRSHNGDWKPVSFRVFDAPRYLDIFTDGRVNNNIVKEKQIVSSDNRHLVGRNFRDYSQAFWTSSGPCQYGDLLYSDFWNDQVQLVQQQSLLLRDVEQEMNKEVNLGGEGLVGRTATSVWVPKRSKGVWKLKPNTDDEAVIMDYIEGKGKHEGRLGAYVVSWAGKQFQLSGMTDYDREHPLARGTTITFRYRTLTDDGYPREARFVREYIPSV